MNGLMESLVALLGLAIALFASTNVDDVFLLLGFFSDPKFRPRDVVVGQYTGIAALFGVSVAASLLSLIGARKLVALSRARDAMQEGLEDSSHAGVYGRAATVSLVTIANGGDNIGIYAPSFAIRSGYEIAVIGLVFAVMTALWCSLAHWMVNHPKLGVPIRHYGHRVAPVALIGLGILILYQAGSFQLLLRHGRA
jgi:cadmium resistance protein CadD (predicted permease)